MKFLTFIHPSTRQSSLGIELDGGRILDVAQAARQQALSGIPVSLMELIKAGDVAVEALRGLVATPGSQQCMLESSHVLFCPPVQPRKNIFCVGRNYREHIVEGNLTSGRPAHQFPEAIEFFTKPPTALTGHLHPVMRHEEITTCLDYEVELAIVIGRRGMNITENKALEHVFGYTIVNDVTARDLQKKHGQWFKGKGLDTSCPIGPVITHHTAIGDPNRLQLELRVNGQIRQLHSTSDMIFNVQRIVSELSAGMTLEPGDIIATGTPQGVGYAMHPPQCLNVGDIMTACIENIGTLENTIAP